MPERAIAVLHVLGWLTGIISVFLMVWGIYFNNLYHNSFQQQFDKLKGIQRFHPVGRYIIAAAIAWSVVYITW